MWKKSFSATQYLKNLFKFRAYLLDNLLTLGHIRLGVVTRQALTCPTNREALVIQEAADLANDQHVLALIIAAVAPSLYRLQLWELLLPIP